MLEVKSTTKHEIDDVMRIINDAKEYFQSKNIDQWQNGYPNVDDILNDINKQISYCIKDDDVLVGTCAISFEKDNNYKNIIDGKWLNDEPYGVIHRICVDSKFKGKGYANKLFGYAEKIAKEKGIHNLRVDTHEKNISMQHLINKNGFEYCGIVFVNDGNDPRIAFQKIF